jgi:hypothetical protein
MRAMAMFRYPSRRIAQQGPLSRRLPLDCALEQWQNHLIISEPREAIT